MYISTNLELHTGLLSRKKVETLLKGNTLLGELVIGRETSCGVEKKRAQTNHSFDELLERKKKEKR